jgi:hypothetical protein
VGKLIGEDWILAQPEARLRYPGSTVLVANSRKEIDAIPGDPAQTSAYSRSFLRTLAPRDEIAAWYDKRLEEAGWRLAEAPEGHPQHWRHYRRSNQAFNLFLYEKSPFKADSQGTPGPSAFRVGATVYQVFFEARADGFPQ